MQYQVRLLGSPRNGYVFELFRREELVAPGARGSDDRRNTLPTLRDAIVSALQLLSTDAEVAIIAPDGSQIAQGNVGLALELLPAGEF